MNVCIYERMNLESVPETWGIAVRNMTSDRRTTLLELIERGKLGISVADMHHSMYRKQRPQHQHLSNLLHVDNTNAVST